MVRRNKTEAAVLKAKLDGYAAGRDETMAALGITNVELTPTKLMLAALRDARKMRWVAQSIARQHFMLTAQKACARALITDTQVLNLFPPKDADIEQLQKILEASLDAVAAPDAETTLALAK